jgi:hypothetical protein
MSIRSDAVPRWVRIVMFLLAVLNLAFAAMGYFSTSVLFPDLAGTGLSPDSPLLIHASREFSARNLAMGLAVLIVSRVGVPEAIAIVTIIRALTELQTILIALMTGVSAATAVPSLVLPVVLLVVEVIIIRSMFGLVARLEAAGTEARR